MLFILQGRKFDFLLRDMTSRKKGGFKSISQISITTDTMVRVLLIGVTAALIYYLWNIVVIFLVSILLAALIDPFADRLEARKIRRGFAVGIIYLIIAAFGTGIFFLVVPTTINQTQSLVETYREELVQIGIGPAALDLISGTELFEQDLQTVIVTAKESGLIDSIPNIFEYVISAFGTIMAILAIAILAFYMVIEERELKKDVVRWFTPKRYKHLVTDVMPKVRKKLGFWLRGQLLIMFIVFLLSFIVLTVLGVRFALILAILAGLFEVVPFAGPILAVIPAVIVAFSASPLQALLVAIFYFLIQQLEADLLTPKIMQKVVGLNPVISILSILVGFELLGVVGALFAVPIAMVIGLLFSEWFKAKEKSEL